MSTDWFTKPAYLVQCAYKNCKQWASIRVGLCYYHLTWGEEE